MLLETAQDTGLENEMKRFRALYDEHMRGLFVSSSMLLDSVRSIKEWLDRFPSGYDRNIASNELKRNMGEMEVVFKSMKEIERLMKDIMKEV